MNYENLNTNFDRKMHIANYMREKKKKYKNIPLVTKKGQRINTIFGEGLIIDHYYSYADHFDYPMVKYDKPPINPENGKPYIYNPLIMFAFQYDVIE